MLKGTVMVVDDDNDLCESLRDAFENDYNVVCFCDSVRALAAVDNTIDLALVDLLMPQINGVDFIRSARLKSKRLKFLLFSAVGSRFTADTAESLGVPYLAKPVSLDVLIETIDRLLRR